MLQPDLAEQGDDLRARLFENAELFRSRMNSAGFNLLPGQHPIIPVMLGEAKLAQEMARALYDEGTYVTGFFYPVVAKGQARIRVQISAAHETHHLDAAIKAFTQVGFELGVLK